VKKEHLSNPGHAIPTIHSGCDDVIFIISWATPDLQTPLDMDPVNFVFGATPTCVLSGVGAIPACVLGRATLTCV